MHYLQGRGKPDGSRPGSCIRHKLQLRQRFHHRFKAAALDSPGPPKGSKSKSQIGSSVHLEELVKLGGTRFELLESHRISRVFMKGKRRAPVQLHAPSPQRQRAPQASRRQ
mmetsp:Transcript_95988/g.200501  ORF Transcript_95988/g.200501 Transcript_95988/m.200501 type:complete len:111 (+) Transcript_95988:64-396(+)